jgi:drug/metabolite transporter (DMT)-like permease
VAKEALGKSTLAATIALIGVTAVWGSTFVVMKAAISRQPESDFLATRFTIATLCMILVRPKVLRLFNRKNLFHGSLLGLALGLGYISQTYGLRMTSAAVSGFITGMFVVFTPLIGAVILRRRVDKWTWLAVFLATIGLALLSLHGFTLGRGEMLTLLCAFAFALHIIGLGEWSPLHDSYVIAIVQLGVVSSLCWIVALTHGYKAPPDYGVWGAVILRDCHCISNPNLGAISNGSDTRGRHHDDGAGLCWFFCRSAWRRTPHGKNHSRWSLCNRCDVPRRTRT